ncbi:Uncharacterized protein DBV15_03183 [Temnothorax longispinosus]|uniref:Peptidoglycan recognition protein 3 n=1 Tax=Temnothorax longispinosus TaxID=300112 RepID=A0A4S2KNB6_9HYME|nr:Uncharacterized protein DBV15_03183 [Temnothorax longispinosus]
MRSSSYLIRLSTLCAFVLLLEYAVLAIPIDNTNFINATECPRIVSRKEWKARERRCYEIMPVRPVPYVVVHHGGTDTYCYDQESCSAIVRAYQNFHIDDHNWCDIGYSFLIGEDGNIYEGRGWDGVGAHAPGYNTQSIGICVIGNFTGRLPNAAALKALNDLIACGVSLGKIKNNYNVIGHRQAKATECPGTSFFHKYVKNLPGWTEHPKPHSPNIISRAQWGARAPKSPALNLKLNPAPYNDHMNRRNWADIGYNFLVGEDGNVYEGRGWDKQGAHSVSYNKKSIGICIIGDYSDRTPNAAAVQAVTNLIAHGVQNRKIKNDYKLLGHLQTWATNCPGNSLYTMIKSWPNWSANP